jgi:3-hydroxyacyl-CoA dehydrogenase
MVPLDQLLSNVAVIGAAGKMGSGIALVLLQEMTRLSIAGKGHYTLHLIDNNQSALEGLEDYLRTQMVKFAERNHGGDNTYVARAMEILKTEFKLDKAKEAHLVFEAIIEDVDIKAKVLKEIKNPQSYYFSNTSSIPIHVLNEKAQLDHRLIGCHFYNPPAIQRLVEIIPEQNGDPKLTELTLELANRMHKVVVESRDVAGFIGNGQFVREIVYANQLTQELSIEIPLTTVIASINRVTQEFLIRPMGIYQLLDYVGIDVAKKILAIMRTYLKDNAFQDALVEKMIQAGVLGGQHPDGSQKDGFFQYEKGRIKGIYSLEHNQYIDIPKTDWLGNVPEGHHPWKDLVKDPEKEAKLKVYLAHLFAQKSRGAELAQAYLINSKQIARKLVEDKVAKDLRDVDKVMEYGFYHLYGPGSDLIKV